MQLVRFKLNLFLPLVVMIGAQPIVANGDSLPRVMLFHLAGNAPNLDVVVPVLEEQLATVGMELEITGMEKAEFPSSDEAWIDLARKFAADARSVGALAYECGPKRCSARLIQVRADAVVSLYYDRPTETEKLIRATASTLREILMGPMSSELRRLAKEARHPSAPGSAEKVLLQSPFESNRREFDDADASKLWLEGAYQGDYPHPSGRPMNGISFGVDFEPASMLGFSLHVGWLGMGRQPVESADIGMQRMTGSLTARLIFSLGPARIAVGAVGRLDLVFLNVNNPEAYSDVSDRYPEVHVGGITTWHLPMPGGLNFILGAGLTASMVSREVEFISLAGNRETAVPASTLRMIWTAGVAFSPLHHRGDNK